MTIERTKRRFFENEAIDYYFCKEENEYSFVVLGQGQIEVVSKISMDEEFSRFLFEQLVNNLVAVCQIREVLYDLLP